MKVIFEWVIIIALGAFFFGMLVYTFYLGLKSSFRHDNFEDLKIPTKHFKAKKHQ